MKLTISTYLMMLMIALISVMSGTYIAMQLEIVAARNYNYAMIDRIQASNFSPNVISEIVTTSTKDGYPTTVTDVTLYEDKKDMLVSTTYSIHFPFFGIEKTGIVEGYAR